MIPAKETPMTGESRNRLDPNTRARYTSGADTADTAINAMTFPPDTAPDLIDLYHVDARLAAARHLERIPRRYQCARIDRMFDSQQPDPVRKWVDDPYAETLLLFGPVGTGKSFAAAAAAVAYMGERLARRIPGEHGGHFAWWSVASLLDALRDPDSEDTDRLWRRVKGIPLLVLDDLAHTRPTPWAIERMWMLINARTEQQLRQVVTSNADWPALVDTWGAGTMDRFRANRVLVKFEGKSLR